MPPRVTVPAAGARASEIFEALDQEFETVQRALVRGGLDPDRAEEVGPDTMLALWRRSADHERLRDPALTELVTRVAGALCAEAATTEGRSDGRSPPPDDAPAE
jgi:hypothetical protein